MPVYNSDRYLEEAIISIRTQTMSEFELLIFDDGSTDDSAAIISKHEKDDSRIHVHTLKHAGYTKALNLGIGLARGEYIARMDSDDISYPDRFAEQLAFFDRNSGCGALGCQVRTIDEDGAVINDSSFLPVTHDEIDKWSLTKGGGAICHPTLFLRRKFLQEVGCYREKYNCAEDLDLWLRIGEIGLLANLSSIHLDYRLHSSQVSRPNNFIQTEAVIRILQDAERRRGISLQHLLAAQWRKLSWQMTNTGRLRLGIKYAFKACRAGGCSFTNIRGLIRASLFPALHLSRFKSRSTFRVHC